MMAADGVMQEFSEKVFTVPDAEVFAVLDGASVPNLLPKLSEEQPEYCCLYRGELEPDLAEAAPYLVRLDLSARFTNWVIEKYLGQHWGIFAIAQADLRTMRKHFRTFLMVYDPEGKPLYFRYYDPRVLRVYLPTCNAEETATVFGPIIHYMCEDETPSVLLRFSPAKGGVRKEVIKLAPAASV